MNLRNATRDAILFAARVSARIGATVIGAVAHPLSLLAIAVALSLSGISCFVADDRPVWLIGGGVALFVLGLAQIRRRAAISERAQPERLEANDPRIPRAIRFQGVNVGAADAARQNSPAAP